MLASIWQTVFYCQDCIEKDTKIESMRIEEAELRRNVFDLNHKLVNCNCDSVLEKLEDISDGSLNRMSHSEMKIRLAHAIALVKRLSIQLLEKDRTIKIIKFNKSNTV